MDPQEMQDGQLERANELYWESGESVNRIAETLSVSKGALYGMIQRQASIVSFVTLFQTLGILFLVMIPLVMLMRRPKGRAGPVAAH